MIISSHTADVVILLLKTHDVGPMAEIPQAHSPTIITSCHQVFTHHQKAIYRSAMGRGKRKNYKGLETSLTLPQEDIKSIMDGESGMREGKFKWWDARGTCGMHGYNCDILMSFLHNLDKTTKFHIKQQYGLVLGN